MKVFKLKQSFSMTLAAMDMNLWRKGGLQLKGSCFRVSEKGRGVLNHVKIMVKLCKIDIQSGAYSGVGRG